MCPHHYTSPPFVNTASVIGEDNIKIANKVLNVMIIPLQIKVVVHCLQTDASHFETPTTASIYVNSVYLQCAAEKWSGC